MYFTDESLKREFFYCWKEQRMSTAMLAHKFRLTENEIGMLKNELITQCNIDSFAKKPKRHIPPKSDNHRKQRIKRKTSGSHFLSEKTISTSLEKLSKNTKSIGSGFVSRIIDFLDTTEEYSEKENNTDKDEHCSRHRFNNIDKQIIEDDSSDKVSDSDESCIIGTYDTTFNDENEKEEVETISCQQSSAFNDDSECGAHETGSEKKETIENEKEEIRTGIDMIENVIDHNDHTVEPPLHESKQDETEATVPKDTKEKKCSNSVMHNESSIDEAAEESAAAVNKKKENTYDHRISDKTETDTIRPRQTDRCSEDIHNSSTAEDVDELQNSVNSSSSQTQIQSGSGKKNIPPIVSGNDSANYRKHIHRAETGAHRADAKCEDEQHGRFVPDEQPSRCSTSAHLCDGSRYETDLKQQKKEQDEENSDESKQIKTEKTLSGHSRIQINIETDEKTKKVPAADDTNHYNVANSSSIQSHKDRQDEDMKRQKTVIQLESELSESPIFSNSYDQVLYRQACKNIKEKDVTIRHAALHDLKTLAQKQPAVTECIIGMIDDADSDIRRKVLETLVSLHAVYTLEVFVRSLHDDNGRVRLAAVRGMYKLFGGKACRYLVRALKDTDPEVCERAKTYIGYFGTGVKKELVQILFSADTDIHEKVMEIIVEINDVSMIPYFISLLEHTDQTIRRSAINCLKSKTGKTFQYDDQKTGIRQQQSIAQWKKWWLKNKDSMHILAEKSNKPPDTQKGCPASHKKISHNKKSTASKINTNTHTTAARDSKK